MLGLGPPAFPRAAGGVGALATDPAPLPRPVPPAQGLAFTACREQEQVDSVDILSAHAGHCRQWSVEWTVDQGISPNLRLMSVVLGAGTHWRGLACPGFTHPAQVPVVQLCAGWCGRWRELGPRLLRGVHSPVDTLRPLPTMAMPVHFLPPELPAERRWVPLAQCTPGTEEESPLPGCAGSQTSTGLSSAPRR